MIFFFSKDDHSIDSHDREQCKTMYIELLEKVFEAFDRIPNCIKDKFPGYDKKTYAQVKYYKSKLKSVINSKRKSIDTLVSDKSEKSNDSNETNASQSLMNQFDDDLDDFHLESKVNIVKRPVDNIQAPDTSTPDFSHFDKPGPSKTIYSDLVAKKSLSFNALSPCNDSRNLDDSNQSEENNDSINKSKGKFVFKKPSRLTTEESTPVRDIQSNIAERIKNASEKLKPITIQDAPKCAPLANSSADFQPPLTNLFNYNKPCTIVSPIVKETPPEEDFDDDITPIDIDDTDVLLSSKVVNLVDCKSNNSSIEIVNNKEIVVNDDGWPEYRIEDFEDDLEIVGCTPAQSTNAYDEINLMEQSVVVNAGKAKYEGMGDFATGTQNDGITGKISPFLKSYKILALSMKTVTGFGECGMKTLVCI